MIHLAMTYCISAFGLGHTPSPLALRDDPTMTSHLLLYYRTKPINRPAVEYESLKLDFV
jgi:hypothetical protein